jgi:hypothetical protein
MEIKEDANPLKGEIFFQYTLRPLVFEIIATQVTCRLLELL